MWADEATDRLASLEDDKGGDSLNAIASGGALMLVDIHFSEAQAILILFAQLLKDRSDGATGGTPRGPEIDNDGFV